MDGFSDGAVSFTPGVAAEDAAPSGESGMAMGGAGPDAVTPLDVQAHAAATSPFNNTPQPTEAQKQAGNYAKGHVKFHGMDISIENPSGSVRTGTDASGRGWETQMQHHYGYIKGTVGKDKDHLDVFIKPGAKSARTAYVIDQIDPKTGKFDEHKIVFGADSEADAQAIYHANYEQGWQGMGAITAMPIEQFKDWIKSGKTKKPLAYVEPKGTAHAAKPKAEPPPAAAIDPAAPYGKVGVAPFSSQVVGLKDNGDGTATVMRGDEPFYDFENGDPITVPTGATAGQIRQAVTDAGALSSRDKWFGVAKAETKPAETGTTTDKSGTEQAKPEAIAGKPVSDMPAEQLQKIASGESKTFGSAAVEKASAELARRDEADSPPAAKPAPAEPGVSTAEQVATAQDLLAGVPSGEHVSEEDRKAAEQALGIYSLNALADHELRRMLSVLEVNKANTAKVMAMSPRPRSINDIADALGALAGAAAKKAEYERAFKRAADLAPTDEAVANALNVYTVEKLQLESIANERGMYGVKWAERNIGQRWTMQSIKVRKAKDRVVAAVEKASAELARRDEADSPKATKEPWQYGELEYGDKYIDETVLPDLRKQLANAHGGKFQEYPSKAAAVRGLKERIDTLENHRDAKARKYYASLDNHYGAVRAALADGKPVPPVAYESYEDLKADIGSGRIKGDGQEVARVEQPQHIEAGQTEPATAPVIAASIKESAKNTPMNIEQAREWLLSEIDKAIIDAKSAKEEGIWNRADDKVNLEGIMDVGATIGFKTFNVPGDGKFRVLNLKESLQKFKKQVAASPGFKKNATRPMSLASGNGGKTSVRDMLEDGEYVLAADYGHLTGKPLLFGSVREGEAHPIAYTDAEPVDIKGIEAQVGREWNATGKSFSWRVIETTTGMSVASESTKEKAISKALAHVDEHGTGKLKAIIAESPKVSQAELERQFTDWGSEEEAKAQKSRDAVERADTEDRALWNSIWPLKDGEKRSPTPWNDIGHLQVAILAKEAAKAGKGDEFVSLIERRRGGTNNVLALAARKALADAAQKAKPAKGAITTDVASKILGDIYRRAAYNKWTWDRLKSYLSRELEEAGVGKRPLVSALEKAMTEYARNANGRLGYPNSNLVFSAMRDYGLIAEDAPDAQQKHGIDYKGFERTPTGNGNFTLKDGNLLVKVEAMGNGKFQASHGSAKSSPHINSEQGAVDWAANLRDASKKTTAYPFYSSNKLFNAEGTAELPKDWTGVAKSDSGKRFFYLGQENGERSFNPLKAESYEDALKEADGLKIDNPAVPDGYREVARGYFGGTFEKPIYAPFAEGERVRFIGGHAGNIQSFIGGPVTTGAIIKYDNGLTGRAEWRDVEAIKKPAAEQEPKHFKSIDTLNAVNNPLGEDDWIRFADGSEWQVKGRMNGWALMHGKTEHPTIKNIMGQVPFIRAVVDANDAAQKPKEAKEPAQGAEEVGVGEAVRVYLDVPFRSKDAAKGWGAKFDPEKKLWYVERNSDGGINVSLTQYVPQPDAVVRNKPTIEAAALNKSAETGEQYAAVKHPTIDGGWMVGKVGAGETAPPVSIAGKPVSEMSDGILNQIAKSSQPAAEKAKAEVARRKKPKVDPLAAVREFYTPGNIIHVDYWNQYDKVLEFKEGDLPGQWNVKVQQVKKDGDQWVPKDDRMEPPRWHATAPGKDKIVDHVAMPPDNATRMRRIMDLDKDAIDAYVPADAVVKKGRGWSYITTQGNEHPSTFDTKHEAVSAAEGHIQLKRDQYADPERFWDMSAILASRTLEFMKKYENQGMREMDAAKRAKEDVAQLGMTEPTKTDPVAEKKYGMEPLSKVIDKVNAKHGEGLTDADRVPTQPPSPADRAKEDAQEQARRENPNIKTTLAEHDATVDRLRDGTATLAEYKAAFQRLQNSTEELTAEFAAMKKDDILKHMGGMAASRYKSDTKAQVVTMAVRDLMDDFSIGRGISYSMGGRDAYANAVRAQVERTTDADLAEYAEHVKAMRSARTERVAQMTGAMKDPKTLADFKMYLDIKAGGTMTREQARMTLTPAQRVAFDELAAEQSREERKIRGDQQRADIRVAATTTDGQVIETKHTKTGEPLFVVKAAERVDRDVYNHWNATAKRLGGWYSSYRAAGAVPGFQFKTRENADAFLAFIGGNVEQAKEAVQTRRDAFEDDRSQTAVERLTEMADRLEERADESLNRDRKENTARRARMAASAEAAANSDKSLAKTMRNIAQAIESGKTKFLDRVRQKAQVEMLRGFLHTAKANELRAKFPSYADQEKHRGAPPTAETADYVDFPRYTAFRSDLATMGRQMLDIDGAKKTGAALLKVADDVSAAYLTFAKEHLHQVSTFKKKDSAPAIFASKDDAETAIKRSGFKGKAVVLPFKRGQNIIIMSPSAAKEAGIWKGDDDKRITLSPDFGEEVVAKVKEFSSHRISMPYLFESVRAERARLKAIGIETAAELRAALREFMDLRAAPPEVDKIKQMERAMIGRKNDGLDFFPTPASVADELVQAAGIEEGMAVLEPSAGMGHIAERIRAAGVDPDVVEMASDRRELLEAKGFRLVGSDFMDMTPRGFTYGDVFRDKDGVKGIMSGSGGMGSNRVGFYSADVDLHDSDSRREKFLGWRDRDELEGVEKRAGNNGYDRIIMNPPFSDRRDAEHVRHAYTLLKPGGRLVAIMGEGVFFGQDKKAQAFRDWLEDVGGTSEKLEDGTFLDPSLPVNTGVNARMVVVEKGEGGGLESRAGRSASLIDSLGAFLLQDESLDSVESGPNGSGNLGIRRTTGPHGERLVSIPADLLRSANLNSSFAQGGVEVGGVASDFHGNSVDTGAGLVQGDSPLNVVGDGPANVSRSRRSNAATLERGKNGRPMQSTKGVSDLLIGGSLRAHLKRLVEIPGQRISLVKPNMVPSGKDLKIVGGVVQAIPIDMVDVFVSGKTATGKPFSNIPVFVLPSNSLVESVSLLDDVTGASWADKVSGFGHDRTSHINTSKIRSIEQVVKRFIDRFPAANQLSIKVVWERQDLPTHAVASENAEAIFLDSYGQVFLVASNIYGGDARVFQILLHECIGHFGLAKMMGSRFGGILKEVMRAARAKGAVEDDIYAPGHQDYATVEAVKLRYPEASDEEIAQEVLARMAETDPGRTLFGYVRAVVRQWLRDMARAAGITLDVTTAELNDLVAQASRYMRRGDGVTQGVDVDALGVADMAVGGMASRGAGMESRRAPAASKPKEPRTGILDTILRKAGGELAAKITSPAYDKLTAYLGGKIPEGIKAGVVSDYGLNESYLDRRTGMQTEQQKAARQTKTFVEGMMDLDRAQSRVAYQWLNNRGAEADRLMAQLPPESQQVLKDIKAQIAKLTIEAVRLGQLDAETAERNFLAYLHRSYAKYDLNTDDKTWKAERAKAIKILGDQYKGRGLKMDVDPDRIHSAPGWWQDEMKGKRVKVLKNEEGRFAFVAEGTAIPPNLAGYKLEGVWEIRARKAADRITLWRDFTQDERTMMGELDEAKYAVARTLFMMNRDIEVGRFHEWVADEYAKTPEEAEDEGLQMADASDSMLRAFTPDEWVTVPTSKIPGTGVFKYGALAGMVIPGPVWNDIRQISAGRFEPFGAAYASILRAWKLSKTALTPTTHVNNIMGNFVMADMHDVGARDAIAAVRLMVAAANGDKDAKAMLDRFEDSGATQGMFTTHELKKEVLEPLLQQLREEVGMADNEAAILKVSAIMSLALHGQFGEAWAGAKAAAKQSTAGRVTGTVVTKAQDYYQAEDSVFRLAAFLKSIDEGKTDLEAGKLARKAFLDYHINAPWINTMRGTAMPFIAFAYRAIPMLVETTARKPWKIAKYMLVAGGLNALAYAMLGADADEDKERAYLPDEKAGRLWGIVPKLIRMPWNRESKLRDGRTSSDPVFLDVRRWIPVGDVVDYGQDKTALPMIPQPMIPGGPAVIAFEFLVNKSAFTGRELTKETDTWVEKAAKVGGHFYKGFAPNVPIPYSGTWAGTKIDNAIKGKEDPLGRAYPVPEAVASGFGLKLERYPVATLQRNAVLDMKGKLRELSDEQRQAARDYGRQGMTKRELDEKVTEIVSKKNATVEEYKAKERKAMGR